MIVEETFLSGNDTDIHLYEYFYTWFHSKSDFPSKLASLSSSEAEISKIKKTWLTPDVEKK